MKLEDKILRLGAAVILGAVILRLCLGSLPQKLIAFFRQPEVASTLVFVQTGRVVRFPEYMEMEQTQSTEETVPVMAEKMPVLFTPGDTALVQLSNSCGYSVDMESYLLSPLDWDLTGQSPTVLILHTHATESYKGSCDNETAYRSLEEAKNMLAIGDQVAKLLEDAGIGVIHDRTLHDYPSYNGAYSHARTQTQAYLQQYPSIRLVLDLHRDAMEDGKGKQISTTVTTQRGQSAQLMMVAGTNAGGLYHPAWKENMALAVKLHAQLEQQFPGICRPINFRSQRFNQDLSTGAMLIEVGTAGNTLDEALLAAQCLADAIISLAHGANP